ncbi:para-nitrobenzyl esterase [Actinoplanes tereljensis]|uniref:Carboxylic ester hydrolase n=1 Tax=Paractinoplanes tereljensis TaxID=571912 RepID=A0A919NWQ9_9ACTN|nr:carboxylesterase family protein [Actinoplanes tereljensis]GIF26731.1 carboxylic ester hydrolase [Actinoplanes tereljensis]
MRSIRGITIAALAVATLALTTGATATGAAARAHTEAGDVRGLRSGGVQSFLGLPYARPPVGALRWQPPQAVQPWHGVRPATGYGPSCPMLASTNGPRSETEDCLYLNVFRPASARTGQRLPVYFWIHGGGLSNGSGSQHDGSLIVRETGVIVVSINYRLGVFGFLAHPGLSGQPGQSGNYGLLDQQAALRWVQRNIGSFGGDPRQVTIGGESAGGFSVCAHLTSPGSRGLFGRAIIQSGSCTAGPISTLEAAGTNYATALGCPDVSTAASCLRAKDVATLLDAAPPPSSMAYGGAMLPENPDTAVRAGRFQRVPMIVGANRDEGRTFAQGFIGQSEQQYTAWISTVFPDRAGAVLARYPWPAESDQFTAAYLVAAVMTDSGLIAGLGGCPTLAFVDTFATYTRTYGYRFDHRTGPGLSPEPPGYVWGAGHAAELAYFWPSFDNGTPIAPTFDAAERRLAVDLVRYWGSFVRTGVPRAPFAAAWPAYNHTDAVLSVRAGGRSVPVPAARMAAEHHCDLWTTATR